MVVVTLEMYMDVGVWVMCGCEAPSGTLALCGLEP